jgi:hypothetical protein
MSNLRSSILILMIMLFLPCMVMAGDNLTPDNRGYPSGRLLVKFSDYTSDEISAIENEPSIKYAVPDYIYTPKPGPVDSVSPKKLRPDEPGKDAISGKIPSMSMGLLSVLDMTSEANAASAAGGVDITPSYDDGINSIIYAAYGSNNHPDIFLLENLRDQYLSRFGLGRRFISAYSRYSSPVVRFIKGHQALRYASRTALYPLVIFSRLLIGCGGIFVIMVISFGYLLPFIIFLHLVHQGEEHDDPAMDHNPA